MSNLSKEKKLVAQLCAWVLKELEIKIIIVGLIEMTVM